MEVFDKLWRIDIDGKLELEIDMVHKMFKRKNIWDSYGSPIIGKCVSIDANSCCNDEHTCIPLPLELIYNGIMEQHLPLAFSH